MRSQDQFGALTCINPCTWLVRSIKLIPRPLHDGVKAISINRYFKEVALYFNTQRHILTQPERRQSGGTKMETQFCFLRAMSKLAPILGLVNISCQYKWRFWGPWPLMLSKPNLVPHKSTNWSPSNSCKEEQQPCTMCRIFGGHDIWRKFP